MTINKDFVTGCYFSPQNRLQNVFLCHSKDNMKTNAEPQNKSNCSLFIRRGRQKNYWQAQTNGPGFTHFSGFFFNQTLRTDRAPQAERPWQPSAFSWIYLILQHSEVMKARQTLGKEYTTTLFRAICLHLKKKKREKNPPSTGRSVNKSNRDRTSFMPDAHVRFVHSLQPFNKTKGFSATFECCDFHGNHMHRGHKVSSERSPDFREGRGEARLRRTRLWKETQNKHASYLTGWWD